MFEKLVVSTAHKGKGRTTTFFICTSIVYLSAIAIAFALSVLFADPKLADTSGRSILIANPLPPPPRGQLMVDSHRDSGGTPLPDPNNVIKYDDLENRPHSGPAPLPLPTRL